MGLFQNMKVTLRTQDLSENLQETMKGIFAQRDQEVRVEKKKTSYFLCVPC